jgi:hypothetical protein
MTDQMDAASSLPHTLIEGEALLENGWYLLRRKLFLADRVCRAGSLVELVDGEWFLEENRECGATISLAPASVCRTFYHGVSLYELECTASGVLYARPVLSEVPSRKIDSMMVHFPIQRGDGVVCIKFGHCFLPLELFNW